MDWRVTGAGLRVLADPTRWSEYDPTLVEATPRDGSTWVARCHADPSDGRDGEGDLDHDRARATGASHAAHARDGYELTKSVQLTAVDGAPTCMSSSRCSRRPSAVVRSSPCRGDRGARPAARSQRLKALLEREAPAAR